jgi:hypothetical protein
VPTLPTLTLVGTFRGTDGRGLSGQVSFTPNAELTDLNGDVILPRVPILALVRNGEFSVNLLPCDAAGVMQSGWAYDVIENISYLGPLSRQNTSVTYTVQPTGTGTVNLASLAHYDPPPVIETYGSLAGDNTWTGANAFQGEVTVPTPVNPSDAATRAYVDAGDATNAAAIAAETTRAEAAEAELLPLAGGTVTGDLAVAERLTASGWTLPTSYRGRSVPYHDALSILTQFQAGHGWTVSGAVGSSNLNDTTFFCRGTQSVRLTTNGTGGGGANLQLLNTGAIDLTNKALRFLVAVDNPSALAQLNFLVGTNSSFGNNFKWQTNVTDGTNLMWLPGQWTPFTLAWSDVGTASGSLTLNANRVPSQFNGFTNLRFQVVDNGTPVTVHFQAVEVIDTVAATFPNGVVSVVFDDSFQNVYDLGRPVMDQYGYRGTSYTIAGDIGSDPTRLTMPELQSLQDNSGWEVAGHAYTQAAHDARFTSLTAAECDDELRNLKAWLVANGFSGDSFAYPGGNYEYTTDGVSIEMLTSRYFNTGRTVLSGYGSAVNINTEMWPPPRPYRMLALSAISDISSGLDLPSNIVATGGPLDTCQLLGSWFILTFHEIVSGTPTDIAQCSQAGFELILAGIQSRGIKVLPVGDVTRLYS